MPVYTFLNTETAETWDETMKYSDLLVFLSNNPHINQVPKPISIGDPYRLGRLKTDNAFRSRMREIHKGTPKSNIDTGNLGEI